MVSSVDEPRKSMAELWHQADSEHPGDDAARRIRYIELMREHGYIVPTLPGETPTRTLECGWPLTRKRDTDD
jgi:hypothetical protein